jgi:hypothetical protein
VEELFALETQQQQQQQQQRLSQQTCCIVYFLLYTRISVNRAPRYMAAHAAHGLVSVCSLQHCFPSLWGVPAPMAVNCSHCES